MPSNHLILCHPLLLLPSIFPSIRVFSNESVLYIRWPKYRSFSFSISPSKEYSGLTSFMIDWLDLLALQGSLKSLFQHHSSKASILWHSALFMVQLSHPYMTTEKMIALTIWTFVCKVMSLLFNMMSRFVIAFLLRSKHLLIKWLQSLQEFYHSNCLFRLVGWISLWSSLRGKSLWPYLFKAYFRPSPVTGSTMLVVDCSVMFSCSVMLTSPWIYTLGKFPIYLLWVWPHDFTFAIMTQSRDMKVTYILRLTLSCFFCNSMTATM